MTENKGDLISRSELKKALYNNCDVCHDKNTNWCEHCCPHNDFEDLIDTAPTVDLEKTSFMKGYNYGCEDGKRFYARPKGEWIENIERRGCFAGDKTVYSYTCPFCKVKEFKKYPFCHCGAD